MAHQIDNSKGFDAYVGYRETPWHKLGSTINERITIKHALELGGLDYIVEKAPNIHRIKDVADIISESSFFTYRTDTNAVLGANVGGVYSIVQNIEALAVIDDIIEKDKTLTIDTAGVLNGGRVSFVCLKRETPTIITKGDEFFQYILLVNGFDGNMSINALYTNVRVVCMNTCMAAMEQSKKQFKYAIRHTKNAHGKMAEALKILAKGEQANRVSQQAFQSMYGKIMTSSQLRDMVYSLLLTDPEITEIKTGKTSFDDMMQKHPRTRNTADKIFEFHENGIGQSSIRGTAWGAYNAVTGYFSNVKSYKNEESRMSNLVFGTANDYCMEAYQMCLNPSAIKTIKPNFGLAGGVQNNN